MEFIRRAPSRPGRLGILPGTFNPPTVAHMALARAARRWCDEILFVLPRRFPHKEFSGASFEQRLAMLRAAVGNEPAYSLAASDRGLFVEIAGECRGAYGPETRLTFLCGRDAAERIAGWDYETPEAFRGMLREFDLLVACREGAYTPPSEFGQAIAELVLPGPFDHVSATEVRQRVARGEPWGHLVPAPIHEQVREIYRSRPIGGPDSPPEKSRRC